MEKLNVAIETEFITATNLLKYAGVVETGGHAHEAILAGDVKVNGTVISEKRKKIYPGDIIILDNAIEISVISE